MAARAKVTSSLQLGISKSATIHKVLNVLTYIHPVRTFHPVTGVGRHINGLVQACGRRQDLNVELLVSNQWLDHQRRLVSQSPLQDFPVRSFRLPERIAERSWKLLGFPKLERVLQNADVLYSPAETAFPPTSVPQVVTLHDIHPLDPLYPGYSHARGWRTQRGRWEHWVKKVFANSAAVLTVSEFCKQRMLELLDTQGTPVHVIGNGVDPFFFELGNRAASSCRRPGDWPYALVVGGLTDRKGGDVTIEVARELTLQKSDLRIVVAGQSDEHWSAKAKELSNIVELGRIPDDELGEFLKSADCLLFLSRYEGFGIPILEAMASGVLAVVSDTSSLPEIAGEAGTVVSLEDPTEIARRIDRLVADNSQKKLLIEAGRARAKDFTWDRCAERLASVFSSIRA